MISGYDIPINTEKFQAEKKMTFFSYLYFMCLKKGDAIYELRELYNYYVLIFTCFV